MDDVLNVSKLRKYYYQIYRKIIHLGLWIKSVYRGYYPMTISYMAPIIFSVRETANELLELADKLEKSLND